MRVGDLFAGIGGFALATERVGWQTAWFSEIDPYASRVLKKHWPNVPNHGDITQMDFTQVEPVDVLCGGFPCQDISVANPNGKGLDGARSGLWEYYRRAIGALRPRLLVVENSPALLARGFERVLGDLAALGYDADWGCIPIAAAGAPHLRERIWLLAYPQYQGMAVGRGVASAGEVATAGGGTAGVLFGGRLKQEAPVVSDTMRSRLAGHGWFPRRVGEELANSSGHAWWATEPGVARVVYGVSARVDRRPRTHGLGNAIGPQIAEAIFRACIERGIV